MAIISETGPHLPVARIVATGGSLGSDYDYYYFETTSEGRYLYGLVPEGTTCRVNGNYGYDFEYEPNDGKFYDVGSFTPYNWGIDNTGTNLTAFNEHPTNPNMQIQYWYSEAGDNLQFQFDNPYYVAPPAPPEPVMRIEPTGGSWQGGFDYYYFETNNGQYIYGLVQKGETARNGGSADYDVKYDPSDGKFHDVGTSNPYKWATDANGTNILDLPTSTNMPILYLYNSDVVLKFQFTNPYYVA